MICQSCGVEAPTKSVAFYQNIGALVMRFSRSVEGNLCKDCVHRYFWKMTLTNLTLGWWGVISVIVTPIFIVNNVARYVLCLGMEPVPPGSAPPALTEAAVERLQPCVAEIVERLNAREEFQRIAEDIAFKSGTTPGQVALFVHALIAAAQQQG